MSPPRLILASRSPRRALLLREAGYVFDQMDPPFEDPAHPQACGDAQQVAMALAGAKASSLAHVLGDREGIVILAADTLIVHHDGALAGTPQSIDEARDMIQRFVDRTHEVVSGIALWRAGMSAPLCFADTAAVSVGHVGPGAIESYLATDQWRGKAGGYNLFERQAAGWPIIVQGEDSTVVGLPMPIVREQLANLGVTPSMQRT